MPDQAYFELRDFHRFLGEKLTEEAIELSPEEALDEWRQLHPDSQDFDAEVEAIRQALDDMTNGDKGTFFEAFGRDFRERHKLPDLP
jgi:hypothetical protein